jgi:hypothetical protein
MAERIIAFFRGPLKRWFRRADDGARGGGMRNRGPYCNVSRTATISIRADAPRPSSDTADAYHFLKKAKTPKMLPIRASANVTLFAQ